MSKIIIPTPLRKFTGQVATIETKGENVKEAILDLALQYPDLRKHLFDQSGKLRNFIRIFVGDEDINGLQKEETSIKPDSVISIIPAIAGG